jgi:hypothetical protein
MMNFVPYLDNFPQQIQDAWHNVTEIIQGNKDILDTKYQDSKDKWLLSFLQPQEPLGEKLLAQTVVERLQSAQMEFNINPSLTIERLQSFATDFKN